MLGQFFKKHESDKIWRIHDVDSQGLILFSFDKKKIYNFFKDYPHNLTKEQKELFDKENPFWANFYLGSDNADEVDDGN